MICKILRYTAVYACKSLTHRSKADADAPAFSRFVRDTRCARSPLPVSWEALAISRFLRNFAYLKLLL